MKKKIIISLMIMAIAIVSIMIMLNSSFFKSRWNNDQDTYSENIEVINRNKTIIFEYGDKVYFRDSVCSNKISDLSSIDLSNTPTVLVINDRSRTCNINDAEYDVLLNKIDNGLFFIYIGEDKLSKFQAKGYFEYLDNSSIKGFTKNNDINGMSSGFWTDVEETYYKKDKELLGYVVCSEIVSYLKKNKSFN